MIDLRTFKCPACGAIEKRDRTIYLRCKKCNEIMEEQ